MVHFTLTQPQLQPGATFRGGGLEIFQDGLVCGGREGSRRFWNPGKVTPGPRQPQPLPVGLSRGASQLLPHHSFGLGCASVRFSRETAHFFSLKNWLAPSWNLGKSLAITKDIQWGRPAGPREELTLEFKAKGRPLAEFLLSGGRSVSVLCGTSTDWLRPTHVMKG